MSEEGELEFDRPYGDYRVVFDAGPVTGSRSAGATSFDRGPAGVDRYAAIRTPGRHGRRRVALRAPAAVVSKGAPPLQWPPCPVG